MAAAVTIPAAGSIQQGIERVRQHRCPRTRRPEVSSKELRAMEHTNTVYATVTEVSSKELRAKILAATVLVSALVKYPARN